MNPVKNTEVSLISLGKVDFKKCWDYQTELFESIVNVKIENRKRDLSEFVKTDNYIILCEHPHVFTLGKSGEEKNLLISEEELINREATYYKINRGGDITYHGPGQLVGYPILDLDNFFTDIHKYLRLLEEVIINTIAHFGLKGERYEGFTGVWIDPDTENARKICAIGVKTGRWVTMHGYALNVNTDLSYFDYIIPCGIDDKAVTSMSVELGSTVSMEKVSELFLKEFEKAFQLQVTNKSDKNISII